MTSGGQAIDWASITTGANTLTNQATGSITAVGEDAGRPGQNGIVSNSGLVRVIFDLICVNDPPAPGQHAEADGGVRERYDTPRSPFGRPGADSQTQGLNQRCTI